jgi:hypothetical protein
VFEAPLNLNLRNADCSGKWTYRTGINFEHETGKPRLLLAANPRSCERLEISDYLSRSIRQAETIDSRLRKVPWLAGRMYSERMPITAVGRIAYAKGNLAGNLEAESIYEPFFT